MTLSRIFFLLFFSFISSFISFVSARSASASAPPQLFESCGLHRVTGRVLGPREGRLLLRVFENTMSAVVLELKPLRESPESRPTALSISGYSGRRVSVTGRISSPVADRRGTLEFQTAEDAGAAPDGFHLLKKEDCRLSR